jgi:predicted MarR family transcription regulator
MMEIFSNAITLPFTQAFRKAVEQYAKEQGLSIVDFTKGEDKDEKAHAYLAKFEKKQGVVLIGKAPEKALGYKGQKSTKGTRVWFNYSRQSLFVTYYYFYILDADFGLFFIKVCTYFPFDIKVCFNRHEWAKQQMRQEGISFEALNNGFRSCENPERLQVICHQLDAEKIQALFDRWVEQLPWPLTQEQRAAGYAHQLSIWQLEVSRTQVFQDPEQGWALFEALIRDNLDLGRPDRVSLIFERKVTKATPSEFHTRVLREGIQPIIRIRYKHSALKQYLKDGRALRTEMVFNNTLDFGVLRGLKNFARLVEMGTHFNDRLLEHEQISQDCFLSLQEMRKLGQSSLLEDGQRASALRFADPRSMAVLEVLACHAYIPKEIGNRSLRGAVAQRLEGVLNSYSNAQMTYDLRRLRLKGLIERIGKSHRYQLTDLGMKVVTFFTNLYHRLFAPGLAALLPDQAFPSDLANALNRVADVLHSWTDQAFILPVTSEI